MGKSSSFGLSFFFLSAPQGVGILVLQPGIKLTPPALEAQSRNPLDCQGSPRPIFKLDVYLTT